jgi:hypothetical protein
MNAGKVVIRPVHRWHVASLPVLIWLTALLASITTSPALTIEVPRLPAPSFADKEVSGHVGLPEKSVPDLCRFRLVLDFNATASNNVQVAFGRDAEPADGHLAAEETDFILGWDSGAWFLRPSGLRERYTFTPIDGQTPRRRTLTMVMRVGTDGVLQSLTFEDDAGAFVFASLSLSPPPSWLTVTHWTHMRVTVRGTEAAQEDVNVKYLQDGMIIVVR